MARRRRFYGQGRLRGLQRRNSHPPCGGYSLSVLALTDRVENVCITGVKYPLHGALVTNSFPIGVSNEWEGAAHISCGAGILLVINAKK